VQIEPGKEASLENSGGRPPGRSCYETENFACRGEWRRGAGSQPRVGRQMPVNGNLGSRNDEDRSEFRYVMRIAELANHQNVERKLHFLEREVFLFECVLISIVLFS
jgi:hypothetical protein